MPLSRLVCLCLLCYCMQFHAVCMAAIQSGDSAFETAAGVEKRAYLVHVPPQYDGSKPMALVLALHGGGGNMRIQANESYYHQLSAADQHGYIVVFPNGYSRLPGGRLATWNAGKCCGAAQQKNINDVAVIRQIIHEMQQRANIDPRRIYAQGMSNGGMMAYRLACELSDLISAVASVAGTDGTLECNPSQAVSILHIHALDDDHVPFQGGVGEKSPTKVSFNAVPAIVQKWIRLLHTSSSPERVLAVPGAYCELYGGGNQQSEVKLCVTERGGHAWPGGNKVRGGDAGSTAISANDLIWQFFSTHVR
ncbi:extracellular catalytic domain type 1 short-chain-length polyhydroxyalkanoate depolymerase [Methylophilus aquaticus]|uniref:PHB depolymerase family esterase n=1 Tax=Methylophilus aquaticus TaxID=1971610 RepID=A0ABT9JWH0_9PROT|nr:PHB depolymerase family esterase [Methylophilus aquaticus]MDP8568881.1 PHB depolymerase family esterase [Methylophilus aquaticus]